MDTLRFVLTVLAVWCAVSVVAGASWVLFVLFLRRFMPPNYSEQELQLRERVMGWRVPEDNDSALYRNFKSEKELGL